ncbi:MAG: hypothetical protein JRJ84_25295 [Deltaproteobacteria bacterium]|nr:hypothetical protein [Deltaproteobacteria bacterium]
MGVAGWLGFNSDRDKGQKRLREASAHLEQLGHPIEATWLTIMLAANQFMLGDIEATAATIESGWRDIPERTPASVTMRTGVAMVHLSRGELTEALAAAEEGVRYGQNAFELLPVISAKWMVFRLQARPEPLREASERAIVLARTLRDPASATGGLQGLAFAQILEGDVPGALATTHRMLDTMATLSREDLVYWMGWARIGRPRPGDAEAGADLFEHFFKQPRAAASRRVLEILLKACVRAATEAGEDEGAARLAEALERLRGPADAPAHGAVSE